MFNRPPPLPEKVLARVLRLATFEGRTMLVLGGLSALASGLSHSWFGTVVSCLVAGCGAIESHGAGLLKAGEERGLRWLVRSQLLLINIILLYVLINLLMLTPANINAEIARLPPADRASLADFCSSLLGFPLAALPALIVKAGRIFYGTLAFVTLLWQGGMALYFHRRRVVIHEALAGAKSPHNPLLTSCPACTKTVSVEAPTCPHCGHPLKPPH